MNAEDRERLFTEEEIYALVERALRLGFHPSLPELYMFTLPEFERLLTVVQ